MRNHWGADTEEITSALFVRNPVIKASSHAYEPLLPHLCHYRVDVLCESDALDELLLAGGGLDLLLDLVVWR